MTQLSWSEELADGMILSHHEKEEEPLNILRKTSHAYVDRVQNMRGPFG
jgi:hypothetical protein